MSLKLNSENNPLSTLKNPFDSEKIESVTLEINKVFIGGLAGSDGLQYKGTIRFKNGQTTGYHYVYGVDFPDLCNKLQNEIDNL